MADGRHPLDAIFAPKTVAVIGATERFPSVGYSIMTNLLENTFGRELFPINLKRKTVQGLEALSHIDQAPQPVDLAIIATPARTVPGVVRECSEAGVKGVIIVSAGFRESGAAGAKLERQIANEAGRSRMRIIGPNCLGVMNPYTSLNATFANSMAQPGSVGFISQSGAFAAAILDWSLQNRVGFSAFISAGSMVDVGWGDLIAYLGQDKQTRSIVIYMESIGEARSFLSAARQVALDKPIIVLKAGRSEAGTQAAGTHTGDIISPDAVFDAAFRRCGVLRVDQIAHLFYLAEVLAKQPLPRGPRLTILTNAGGPGIVAADALLEGGGQLAALSAETLDMLDAALPGDWARSNPVNLLADADPLRYVKAMAAVAQTRDSDGILVILTPQDMTSPTQTARELKKMVRPQRKPILASWMGGADVAAGHSVLNQANIPTFDYPDTAARIFNYMWRYSRNLRSLYETPTLPPETDEASGRRAGANAVIAAAHQMERTILTEVESKQILAAYGIPVVETRLAASEAEAVQHAEAIGYPVVLKLHTESFTDKSRVGGVRLNLANTDAARQAYQVIQAGVDQADFLGVTVQPMLARPMVEADGLELLLGSSIDPQFGPTLLFGLAGGLMEVYRDYALALPPLTSTLARRMMEQTRIFRALQAMTIDQESLIQLLVRFSHLVAEQRRIAEIDINPLLVTPKQLLALDASIILHPPDLPEKDLPRLAIRPYPSEYITSWQLKDGTPVTIRPIRPEDETIMVQFHQTLSDESVYYRFFQMIPLARRIEHERLSRICFIDYDREMALVVEQADPQTGQTAILGVGRLVKEAGTDEATFGVLVSDDWRRQGIGSRLLQSLVAVGRREGVKEIAGAILPQNQAMQALCKKLGFTVRHRYEDRVVEARLAV